MNKIFLNSFYNLVDMLKQDSRCFGAWYFGSISRGQEDEYSDIDVVFLVDSDHFEGFENTLENYIKKCCDEIVCIWPETFNCDELKNYQYIIKLSEDIFILDIFLLNSIKNNSWIAKMHYTDLSAKQVIFDKQEKVNKLIKKSPKGSKANIDISYVIKTYYTHLNMLVKYFLRKDYFKIRKNTEILYNTHTELLLGAYDKIGWGDYCVKIKHCVPENLQEHLKLYLILPDIEAMKKQVLVCAECFAMDAQKICEYKNIQYPKRIEQLIMDYYKKQLIE